MFSSDHISTENVTITIKQSRHLGLKKEIAPHARGFDKSFVYLPGAGNHYNNEPQLDSLASSFIIPALRSDNLWMRDGDILDRKNEEHIPKDFYSTTNFTTELLTYLKQRNNESSSSPADGTISDDQDGEKSEGEAQHDNKKPFFAYLAYTAPHWPLQAPRATIDKYTGVYSDGPHALRQQRLDALIARGLVPKDVEPAPMVGDETLPPWSSLSDEEKALSSRRMETYAAMVDLIDQNLARVVDYLEETGELDNTFILFMSDNGAEGKLLEALPVSRGMPLSKIVEEYYDNSMENIGNADSFVWYGPQWACAATAPSKGFKIMVTEGGIRCPCIVRYPGFAASSGKVTHDFTTVMDILPTILEMAGVPHPGTSFRGREVVLPRGRSWKAWLENGAQSTVHENGAQDVMGWELFGRRAIRKGNWKAVFEPAPKGTEEWQLFDLSKDAGEIHDLAEQEPKVLEDLLVEWERYFTETGMYDPSTEAAKSKW